MPIQVVIPDSDPLIPLLEEAADRRGLKNPQTPCRPSGSRRRGRYGQLPKLARQLITERLRDLKEHGDPMAAPSPS